MTISIVTPWLDHPELIADYERAVDGAQVIVVDNGSERPNADALQLMVRRLGGHYIRNERNEWFTKANNQGLQMASSDVVLFLNNDISAPAGWLDLVERDCGEGVLCGPSVLAQIVDGRPHRYIEGWCIGARRDVWLDLGGWDETFVMPYWEDNDLCLRATRAGFVLRQAAWPVRHKSNTTSRHTAEAYSGVEHNRALFESRARATAMSL